MPAPKIILAPMDGITDYYVRQILTAVGGYDLCMTEFLRVTESVFPRRVFFKTCPEINPENGLNGKTRSGVAVHLQLLGCHSAYMAENAYKASAFGVKGIDINFGCPAKTVNGHGGGAILLKSPAAIYDIVSSVKKALPDEVSLSVKMRMGYEDTNLMSENVQAIESGGANFITLHARTKTDAYRPPARWAETRQLLSNSSIPIILNGEIWNLDDYKNCQQASGCRDIMLGRGAFAAPDLALRIKNGQQQWSWLAVKKLLLNYYHLMVADNSFADKYIVGRLKLWCKWLMASYDEAVLMFDKIKRKKNHQEVYSYLTNECL